MIIYDRGHIETDCKHKSELAREVMFRGLMSASNHYISLCKPDVSTGLRIVGDRYIESLGMDISDVLHSRYHIKNIENEYDLSIVLARLLNILGTNRFKCAHLATIVVDKNIWEWFNKSFKQIVDLLPDSCSINIINICTPEESDTDSFGNKQKP